MKVVLSLEYSSEQPLSDDEMQELEKVIKDRILTFACLAADENGDILDVWVEREGEHTYKVNIEVEYFLIDYDNFNIHFSSIELHNKTLLLEDIEFEGE